MLFTKSVVRTPRQKAKIAKLSDGRIELIDYGGSSLPSEFQCKLCGHKWEKVINKITAKTKCPNCKFKPLKETHS